MKLQVIALGLGIVTLAYGALQGEQQTNHAQLKGQAEQLFARAKPEDYTGDKACAECHVEKSQAFINSPHSLVMSDPSLPPSRRGCEGCHGPGKFGQEATPEVISFSKRMSPKESAAACLRCHGQNLSKAHWKMTDHAKAGLTCVSCHQIHPDSDPNFEVTAIKKGNAVDPRSLAYVAKAQTKDLLKADEQTLCGQCHAPQVADFRQAYHHPVIEGRMSCSDCHALHPSKNDKAHKSPFKDKCVTCHTEKAGPFIFEHDPVAGFSGDGCQECHRPHGSNNPAMLIATTRGLCAQCHTDKLANHHTGQTCWQAGCHASPHGSNTSPQFLQP